ncbi:MAG: aldo/keto reductase [Synergistaceae bacterium]|nr:aldo/keto reductase [Synergistaceae bacterium]MBQ6738416.1 aldo/keto reductase [Synergistaceae bacterium]MBQ7068718.1 aldo/keto reductase [Synergistaceae bacterium]MBR0317539.1 aldo/keto reductase [Synergistaceae bacterium]
MNYRELGNTGLKVSEIALGCEGMVEENYSMCKKLFDLAEKSGINYFDLYSPDPDLRAAIGNALHGRREKFIIQSHLSSVWKNGQYERSRILSEVKDAFEESLKLLQVNFIDVGMIHYCDALDDWETILKNGILDYARELKSQGKIKHIGLSSHNPEVALKAVESNSIEVLMFSVNPCYDLQPASENVEDLWADENYENHLTNMNPERQKLYETCQRNGVGITVMKCFGGGDLLNAELSPAGAALTVNQCISYALSRPGVSCILAGAHSVEQLQESLNFETASDSEKDYALALSSFPKISWKGHCMYCSHCEPCPKKIDIASVTKFLNLAFSQKAGKSDKNIPETVREHYKLLTHHAGECIQCGACEKRCPFDVKIRENMKQAEKIFGM